jgi:phage tail sheath protein FI
MGVYLSPGVYVRERDISNIIPNLSTTVAAIVGYSSKGSVDDIKLITTPQDFITEYGTPQLGQYFHYSALAFLEKGNRLYCQRVVNGALYGGAWIIEDGGSGANTALIMGMASPVFQTVSGQDILFYIFAKDPGIWNNSLSIKLDNIDATDHTFDIVVYTKDSDGNYTEMERWTVSRQTKVDGFGKQMYMETKINGYSIYIVVKDNVALADTVMPATQTSYLDLGGGADGSAVTDSQVIAGWNKFANPDDIDIRVLINSGYASTAVQTKMKTVAEGRADCIAILDMPYSALTSVTAMVNWRDSTQDFNSSYCALYAPWLKIYDQWNDKQVEVPPSGYVASQIAYNDYVADPWFAPAGFNRGLLNILSVTNVFTKGERDTLYQAQINPIQLFRGEGIAIWGNKTEQVKASALSSVNVRRLLITLEKSMSVALRNFVFEPNNELTRLRVTATLEQYMDLLSSRGAFQVELGDKGYRVVCDSTNNTPATIDLLELHVDVYIKPIRAAEYIQLQAIITTTGASFEELIARNVLL